MIEFIIGIVFAILLYYIFIFKNIYHGPNSNIVKTKVFFNKNKNICYKFIPKAHICPLSLKKKH
jgi:hypothetical protein